MITHLQRVAGKPQATEYFERLEGRVRKAARAGQVLAPLIHISAISGKHLMRFNEAARRLGRAERLGDRSSQLFERTLMYVLLYETVDHLCMVLNLLDFDTLDLESALDGHGLAGESASEVVTLLSGIDKRAHEVLSLEKAYHLHLDFGEPLDEKRGLTFTEFAHWQDFVPGSLAHSFRDYFRNVRQNLHHRLEQRPVFWKQQSLRQYLHRRRHDALLRIIERLEGAAL